MAKMKLKTQGNINKCIIGFLGYASGCLYFHNKGLNELKASKNDWEFYCLGRHLVKNDQFNYPDKKVHFASQHEYMGK